MLLRPGQLDDADVRAAPFPLLIAHDVLDPVAMDPLDTGFPRYAGAGYFPHDTGDCGEAVNALVAELTSPRSPTTSARGWASSACRNTRRW
jgi:hypothetical protein